MDIFFETVKSNSMSSSKTVIFIFKFYGLATNFMC